MHHFRRILSAWLLSLCAVSLAAQPVIAAPAEEAGKFVETLGSKALEIISDKASSKEQKEKSLENLFSANVDIQWVARFVLGRYWRTATDEQKKAYLANYERFLLRHYTSRFADYTGGTFRVIATKNDGDNEFTVNMSLQNEEPGSEPVFVDYRLRKEAASFKVFDIIVEGVSLITTQRSEFASVIASHDLDHLISQLDTKSLTVTTDK